MHDFYSMLNIIVWTIWKMFDEFAGRIEKIRIQNVPKLREKLKLEFSRDVKEILSEEMNMGNLTLSINIKIWVEIWYQNHQALLFDFLFMKILWMKKKIVQS